MTSELATTTTAPAPLAFLHDGAAFDHLWRVAKAFSLSGMVPEHFRGKPESCMVALMYAEQLGEHPMVMFQEVTVIKGRPGTSARFAIARANKSGLLAGPITWTAKGQGEALEVTATATMRESGEKISATVTMREAIADGWTRNDKYKSIPGQMLRWRAATRLINLYIPEVLFGLGVREDVEPAKVRDVTPSGGQLVEDLNQQIAAAATTGKQPEPAAAEPEPAPEPEPVDAEIVEEAPRDPF